MRIAHVIFSFKTGGAETMLVDILNTQALTEVVHLIIINAEVNPFLIQDLSSRIKVHRIGRVSGSRSLLPFIRLNYKLFKVDADVIHCHTHNISKFILKRFLKLSCLTVHDTGYPTKYFKRYSKLFSISKAVHDDIKCRSGIESCVVSNGIKVSDVASRHLKETKDKTFRIVQVSRLMHEKKGQDLLIYAIQHLRDVYGLCAISVDFIGEGESMEYLTQLAKACKVDKQIRFLGLLDRAYVYRRLGSYDLLVQPSRFEGFGLTIVEALAANIEVLTSDIQGPAEILESLNVGYTFKSGDWVDLADKIKLIISNPSNDVYQYRSKVQDMYDVKRTAANYLLNYKL